MMCCLAMAPKQQKQQMMDWNLQNYKSKWTFSPYKFITSGICSSDRKLANTLTLGLFYKSTNPIHKGRDFMAPPPAS
jgi:hypothetical protein